MPRPAAVTVSAIVAMIGSVLALVFATVMLFAAGTATPELQQLRGLVTWTAVLLGALALFGVWTAIELLRVKRWARTSMLIFAGVTAAVCAFGIFVVVFIPVTRTNVPASAQRNQELAAIAVYAVPLLISAWWLWLFNTASVKAAFAGDAPAEASRRPLSVSIIGWWSLLGGVMTIVPALTGLPVFLVGFTFEGMTARVIYLIFGVLSAMIGWDLLQLHERGRRLGIAWMSLGAAQVALSTFVPSVRERMQEFEKQLPGASPSTAGDAASFMTALMALSLVLFAVGIWLLVRNKAAFQVSA